MSVMPFLVMAAKHEQDRKKLHSKGSNSDNDSNSASKSTIKDRDYLETDYIMHTIEYSNNEVKDFFLKLFEYGITSIDEYREFVVSETDKDRRQAMFQLREQEKKIENLGIEFIETCHFFDMPETYSRVTPYFTPLTRDDVGELDNPLELINEKDRIYSNIMQNYKKKFASQTETKVRKQLLMNEYEELKLKLNKLSRFEKKKKAEITERMKGIKKEIKDIDKKLYFDINSYKRVESYLSLTMEQKEAIIEYEKTIIETQEKLEQVYYKRRTSIPYGKDALYAPHEGYDDFWLKALSKMISEENITPQKAEYMLEKIDEIIQNGKNSRIDMGASGQMTIYSGMLNWFFKKIYHYDKKQEISRKKEEFNAEQLTPEELANNEEARKASETFDRETSRDILEKDETNLDEQDNGNR